MYIIFNSFDENFIYFGLLFLLVKNNNNGDTETTTNTIACLHMLLRFLNQQLVYFYCIRIKLPPSCFLFFIRSPFRCLLVYKLVRVCTTYCYWLFGI